ncbi:MAG: chitosanase, partial [Methylomonas sp.]
DTDNTENAIKPIFDQQKVENEINAQVQITQVFGQQASKLIGDYANEKYQAAVQANDKDAMDSWGEGGSSRIALHSVIAGLSGYYGAAVGTAVSQALVPHLGELLILASLDPIVKQVLIEAAGFAIGSVAGNSGAVAAFNATTNNYLMHNRLVDEEGELLKLRENQAKGNCDSVCKSRIEELENLDKQRDIAIQPYVDDCQKAGRSNCRGEAVARRYADTNGFGDLAMAKESNPGSLGSPFSFNNCPSSDKGGCSYGPLQIAANNGMVENFLTDLKNNPSDEAQYFYKRLMAVGGSQASKTNDPNFVNVWMELTEKDPQFVQYQMDTLINRNLYPALLELRKVGVDWNILSREEKNMLFSAAVQHGAGVQSKAKGLDNILERTFSNSEITPPTQHTYTREDQIYDEVEFQLQQAEKEIQKFDKKIQLAEREKNQIFIQKENLWAQEKALLLQQKTSNVNQQLLDTIDSKIQALDAQINGLTSKANTLTEQKNEQYRYIDDAKRYLVESARNTVGDEEGFIKRFYQERKEMYPQEAKRYDDEINQLLKALHSRSK